MIFMEHQVMIYYCPCGEFLSVIVERLPTRQMKLILIDISYNKLNKTAPKQRSQWNLSFTGVSEGGAGRNYQNYVSCAKSEMKGRQEM